MGDEVKQTGEALEEFLQTWPQDSSACKQLFIHFMDNLMTREAVRIEFVPRPGVSYSLRARRENSNRAVFALVDVIETDPRWLSVCFYAEMVDDVEQLGNIVPGGLLGEDGLCFDIEDENSTYITYIISIIDQAYQEGSPIKE